MPLVEIKSGLDEVEEKSGGGITEYVVGIATGPLELSEAEELPLGEVV